MDTAYILALICILVGSILTFIFTKYWIRLARGMGFTGEDMNKEGKPEVPKGGGFTVVIGIVFGLLLYVFFKIFLLDGETSVLMSFVGISTILLSGFLGFIDDILGWKEGLRQWQKPLLTIPIALPLVVVNAGVSRMGIPFLGSVELGLVYPLFVVPVAVVCASNGYNLIAGLNGLESRQGIIIFEFLGFYSYFIGQVWVSFVSFLVVGSLLGFWLFNRYPAEVFPGDSFTYSVGAMVGFIAIVGNMEKVVFIIFIPYIIEFFLKLRSKFRAESFGIWWMDGTLKNRYGEIYSINHIFYELGLDEKWTVLSINIIQFVVCVIAISL